MIASNPYEGPRIPGSVGRPLPAVEVRVTDPETGAGLSTDNVGMIEVKGPNVFNGFWNMPEKTAAEFRPDGFFITGDLGKFDARGYLHIIGRGKDLNHHRSASVQPSPPVITDPAPQAGTADPRHRPQDRRTSGH